MICANDNGRMPKISIAPPARPAPQLRITEKVERQARAIMGRRSRMPIPDNVWALAIADQIEMAWFVPSGLVRDELEGFHMTPSQIMANEQAEEILGFMGFEIQKQKHLARRRLENNQV